MDCLEHDYSSVPADRSMAETIILDSGSSTDLFCNHELVDEIQPSDTVLQLSTNGGILTTDKEAKVPGYGRVWFNV